VKHGLDGNIKRVTKTVFLLSPTHVVVADEDEPEVTGMENSDDLDIRRPY
jgi:FtsZ-interacting cell division protein YlmF